VRFRAFYYIDNGHPSMLYQVVKSVGLAVEILRLHISLLAAILPQIFRHINLSLFFYHTDMSKCEKNVRTDRDSNPGPM
jgi:hypothetical protein